MHMHVCSYLHPTIFDRDAVSFLPILAKICVDVTILIVYFLLLVHIITPDRVISDTFKIETLYDIEHKMFTM